MTDSSIALREYLRKIGADLDGDFLRGGVQLLTQMLIELEAEQQIGAAKYERSPNRKARRNGYQERMWQTREGEIPLRIPKLREGTYFPSLLEPRRRLEKALLAMVQMAYVKGVSTRKVDDLLQALGLTGIDKSKVSRICKELDEAVEAFLNRPLEGEYPYLWLDTLYLKVRQNHRIVSQAMRGRWPKAAELLLEAEEDILAYMALPPEHWTRIYSTNPLGRLNKEIKRRTYVVGVFPDEGKVVRLVGSVLIEIDDEWKVVR